MRWPLSAETRKKQKGQKAQKITERLDFLQKQPLSVLNQRPLSAEFTLFCRNPPFLYFLVSAEIAETLSGAFSTDSRKSALSVGLYVLVSESGKIGIEFGTHLPHSRTES